MGASQSWRVTKFLVPLRFPSDLKLGFLKSPPPPPLRVTISPGRLHTNGRLRFTQKGLYYNSYKATQNVERLSATCQCKNRHGVYFHYAFYPARFSHLFVYHFLASFFHLQAQCSLIGSFFGLLEFPSTALDPAPLYSLHKLHFLFRFQQLQSAMPSSVDVPGKS